jgi:hypothetical protein
MILCTSLLVQYLLDPWSFTNHYPKVLVSAFFLLYHSVCNLMFFLLTTIVIILIQVLTLVILFTMNLDMLLTDFEGFSRLDQGELGCMGSIGIVST